MNKIIAIAVLGLLMLSISFVQAASKDFEFKAIETTKEDTFFEFQFYRTVKDRKGVDVVIPGKKRIVGIKQLQREKRKAQQKLNKINEMIDAIRQESSEAGIVK